MAGQRGRPPGQIEKVVVDSFVVVQQRRGSCHNCGSIYTGHKKQVKCIGCKAELETVDHGACKKIPVGVWSVFKDKQISNSSIMGEVIADGGDAAG